MPHQPLFQVDHRERKSGIPGLLKKENCRVRILTLEAGDYVINNLVTVERKSAEDFVLSVIQQRLFYQCKKLKTVPMRSLLIIEGNPYKTRHSISLQAVKGAVMAVTIGWQIPVLFAKDVTATAEQLIAISRHLNREQPQWYSEIPFIYKPKKQANRQIHFLSTAPGLGKARAATILQHFGTLKNVINATEIQLQSIPGIGLKTAKAVVDFFNRKFGG